MSFDGRQRQSATADASLGDLFGRLTAQAGELVRHEVRLAQAELKQKAREAGRGAGLIAAGGLIAYAGLIALVFALIWALDIVLPLWLAALIVATLVIAGGAWVAWYGMYLLRTGNLTSSPTVETMEENARWAKREVA